MSPPNIDECKLFYNLISKIGTKNNDSKYFNRSFKLKQIIKIYCKFCKK